MVARGSPPAARPGGERASASLDALLAEAPVGIAFLDRDLRFLSVNELLAGINGLPVEAHLGRPLSEVLPALAPALEPLMRSVLDTGAPAGPLELAGASPASPAEQHTWLVSCFPVREGGSVAAVGAIVQDVTALRRAEQARSDVLERVRDGFVAFDRELRYTYVNERAAELFGRRPEDLVGRLYLEEYPEAAGTPFHRVYERALETQQPLAFEQYYEPWDRWFENRVYPSEEGLTVYFTEITERKRAEQALRESEERYRRIVDNAREGVVTVDAGGTVTFVNARLCEIVGRPAEELLGKRFDELVPSEERSAALERWRHRPKASRGEYRVPRPDGRTVVVRASSTALHTGDGSFEGVLTFVEDVSAQREAEEERERLLERLRAIDGVMEVALGRLPLDELLGRLLSRIREALGCDSAAILLLDEQAGRLTLRAAVGLEEERAEPLEVPLGRGVAGRIASERKPVRIDDLAEGELWSPALRGRLRSLLGAPLEVGERALGVIHAGSAEPARFDDDDLRLLALVAERAAAAIDRAQTEEELARSEERLRLLHEISLAVLAASSPQEIAAPALDRLLRLLPGCTRTSVGLVDVEQASWTVIAAASRERTAVGPGRQAQLAPEQLAALLGGGTPVLADLRLVPDPSGSFRQLLAEGNLSAVALPLAAEGALVGVLTLFSDVPGPPFAAAELDLAREVAAPVAIALRQAALREELERRARELGATAERLRATNEIGRAVLAARSLEEIATTALAHLRRVLPCPRASLDVLDEERGEAVVLAVDSERPRAVPAGTRLPLETLGELAALRWGEARAVEDFAAAQPPPPVVERLLAEGLRSALHVPLVAEGELLGTLDVCFEQPGAEVEAEALATLREVADELAIALRQARLREELERWAAELAQRVEERTAELAERNEELDAFAYSVSHDLRAPLRAMHGFALALLEDFGAELPDPGRDYARRIVGAAEQMDGLIQDLLAYSRLTRVRVTPAPVALDEVVGDVLRGLEAEVASTGATIEVEGPLPTVLAQRPVLDQVVSNLVGNALKFTAAGTPAAVRVAAEKLDGRVRLLVQDEGIGIAPEHLERVFGAFERLHGGEAYPGTGIGLAIVKKGVERLGGTVGVESAPGQGSRFWIELAEAQEP